jgi:hypothetical protein
VYNEARANAFAFHTGAADTTAGDEDASGGSSGASVVVGSNSSSDVVVVVGDGGAAGRPYFPRGTYKTEICRSFAEFGECDFGR